MFAVSWPEQKGFACSLKTSEMTRLAYDGVPGIVPAPYLARAGWLRFEDGSMPDLELLELMQASHRIVTSGMTRKLRMELGLCAHAGA